MDDPDQTASQKQSDLGLHCLFRPLLQTTCAQNFRTFTVPLSQKQDEISVLIALSSNINGSSVRQACANAKTKQSLQTLAYME